MENGQEKVNFDILVVLNNRIFQISSSIANKVDGEGPKSNAPNSIPKHVSLSNIQLLRVLALCKWIYTHYFGWSI